MSKGKGGPPDVKLFAAASMIALGTCESLALPPGWRWRVLPSVAGDKVLPLLVMASGSKRQDVDDEVETSRFPVTRAHEAQAQAWVLAVSAEVQPSDCRKTLDAIIRGAQLLEERRGLPPGEAAIRELAAIVEDLPDEWSIDLTFRRDEVSCSLIDDQGEEVHVDADSDGFAANVRVAKATLADREEAARLAVAESEPSEDKATD